MSEPELTDETVRNTMTCSEKAPDRLWSHLPGACYSERNAELLTPRADPGNGPRFLLSSE